MPKAQCPMLKDTSWGLHRSFCIEHFALRIDGLT